MIQCINDITKRGIDDEGNNYRLVQLMPKDSFHLRVHRSDVRL